MAAEGLGTVLDRVCAPRSTHSGITRRRRNGRTPSQRGIACRPCGSRGLSRSACSALLDGLVGAPRDSASDSRRRAMTPERSSGSSASARRQARASASPKRRSRRRTNAVRQMRPGVAVVERRARSVLRALTSGTTVLHVARPVRAAQQRPGEQAMRSAVIGSRSRWRAGTRASASVFSSRVPWPMQRQRADHAVPGVEVCRAACAGCGRCSAAYSSGSIAATTPLGDLVLHREDVGERRGRSARPRRGCRLSASISCAVMRTRLPALRTLPSST